MDRYRLGETRLTRNANSGDLLLLVDGALKYKSVLSRAFPQLFFSRSFEDRHGRHTWGTYIKRADDREERQLAEFCDLLRGVWLLEDDLDESLALALHKETSASGTLERTALGQLVYEAKSYRETHPGDQTKAGQIAIKMAEMIGKHPAYKRAQMVVSVPQSNFAKAYDLSAYLREFLASTLGMSTSAEVVRKIRSTRPMKDCRTLPEKIDNVQGAYLADTQVVNGRIVLIIDDIYQTGFSINEVGHALRLAGAKQVLGLVATKTAHDLGESSP